jgi:hypothetical protein
MIVRTCTGVLLLLLPLTTACSDSSRGAGGTGPPALAKPQAAQVLARYTETVNRANAAAGRSADTGLLRSVTTGPQLEMAFAADKFRRAAKEPYQPISFTKPVFYIPRLTGYPRWFAVDAVARTVRHALVFSQDGPQAPWLLAAGPYLGGAALAATALDDEGYAAPVSPAKQDLAMTPEDVRAVHATLMTSGTGAAHGLAAGPHTSESYAALRKATGQLRSNGITLTTAFTPNPSSPVYTLRTKNGGALVWYTLRQREIYVATKPGAISVTGDLVGLVPAKAVKTRLNSTALIQYLAAVPPKGQVAVVGQVRKAVRASAS